MDNNFVNITKLVIDKLEGGYVHPDMFKDGRAVDRYNLFRSSGETMYGLDRYAGHNLYYSTPQKTKVVNGKKERLTPAENMKYIYDGTYEYKNKEAKEFWTTIDKLNARKNWRYNYLPTGELKDKLQALTAEIMYPNYQKFANRYLSQKSKEIVEKDNRLLFNFIYATWNGEGWFKTFAQKMNDAVNSGIQDTDKLTKIVLNARINNEHPKEYARKLISEGGVKIASFIDTLKGKTKTAYVQATEKYGKNTINIGIGLIFISLSLAGGGLLYYYMNKNKK